MTNNNNIQLTDISEHFLIARQMPSMYAYREAARGIRKYNQTHSFLGWQHHYGLQDPDDPEHPIMVVIGQVHPDHDTKGELRTIVEEAGGVPYNLPGDEVIALIADAVAHQHMDPAAPDGEE